MNPALEDLSPQKRMFVLEYIKDFKPGAAAQRVGFSSSTGSSFLGEPDVQAAVAAAMEERIARTEIDADWVLEKLGRMFDADLADIFHPGTDCLRPIHEWPEIWRKMASGIKIKEEMGGGFVKDVKIIDRLKALELIGKHTNVKAFMERVELATDQELTERLLRGRKRARQMSARANEEMSFL